MLPSGCYDFRVVLYKNFNFFKFFFSLAVAVLVLVSIYFQQ